MAYFNNDGNEINPNLLPEPQLCLSCIKNEDKNEEVLCNLTRLDKNNNNEFICDAYESISNK